MRISFVLAAVVVLGGCATGRTMYGTNSCSTYSSYRTCPPPRMVSGRLDRAPAAAVRAPITRTTAPAAINRSSLAGNYVPSPPQPPSIEVMRRGSVPGTRRSAPASHGVPVGRSARVEPAMVAPAMPPAAVRSAPKGNYFGTTSPTYCPGGT